MWRYGRTAEWRKSATGWARRLNCSCITSKNWSQAGRGRCPGRFQDHAPLEICLLHATFFIMYCVRDSHGYCDKWTICQLAYRPYIKQVEKNDLSFPWPFTQPSQPSTATSHLMCLIGLNQMFVFRRYFFRQSFSRFLVACNYFNSEVLLSIAQVGNSNYLVKDLLLLISVNRIRHRTLVACRNSSNHSLHVSVLFTAQKSMY